MPYRYLLTYLLIDFTVMTAYFVVRQLFCIICSLQIILITLIWVNLITELCC